MLPTTFDQFARSEANDASDCLHRFCGVSMQILDPTGVTHRPPGVEGGPLGNLAKRANTLDGGYSRCSSRCYFPTVPSAS